MIHATFHYKLARSQMEKEASDPRSHETIENILLEELGQLSSSGLHSASVIQEVPLSRNEKLASALLERYNLMPSDSARLIVELLELTQGYDAEDTRSILTHCRRVIQLGADSHAKESQTLPFEQVVNALIINKAHRRHRTIGEIRQYCDRLMRHFPSWKSKPLRHLDEHECQRAVSATFHSPMMQRKAYVILHGVFNFGIRRGWCSCNPITLIDVPQPREKRIRSLSMKELIRLVKTALLPEHLPCAPAFGLMLWAGIRPNEMERLTWGNIIPKDNVIEIQPQHSKTGGHRQVTLQPALKSWLRRVSTYTFATAPIAPRAWDRRWRELRRCAGFTEWQADILRHTFASYHLKHFRDLSALQIEMGHATTQLLRTRYLALNGITEKAAQDFWTNLPRLRTEMG